MQLSELNNWVLATFSGIIYSDLLGTIVVGLAGFEPATPRCLSYELSVVCSNHAELQARRVVSVMLLF